MNVGIVGYSQSGKTLLFRAVAGAASKGDVASVPVPDPRLDFIVSRLNPKKHTFATIALHDDLDSVQRGGKALTQRFLDAARRMELLLHVVRAFDFAAGSEAGGGDPKGDVRALDAELMLADLQVAESRLDSLSRHPESRQPGKSEYLERAFLERAKGKLEAEGPLRTLELDDEEAALARGLQLVSVKPLAVAINVDEAQATRPTEASGALVESLTRNGVPAFAVCSKLEAEIAELEPADRPAFLESLGLSEPASAVLMRAVYEAMGLITFFTTVGNEVRAWPLRIGSTALKAAAAVHTDIARGFIRAEVVHFADFEACGSLSASHDAGKMRLEGKEYVVQDGDILMIRNKT